MMRWCPSLFIFGFLAAVNALSSSGNRLLVVLEDAAERGLYSTLWGDLEGMPLSQSGSLVVMLIALSGSSRV